MVEDMAKIKLFSRTRARRNFEIVSKSFTSSEDATSEFAGDDRFVRCVRAYHRSLVSLK